MTSQESLDYFLSPLAQEIRALSVEQWGEKKAVEIAGHNQVIFNVLDRVGRFAPFQEPVLIVGESGSGKEALAQASYLLSPRRGKPFVAVNCPQYQDGNLTVSELFGHCRGSFTGAIADRKGCFESGDGGVIFLDEIADLHMSAQVMLLRALASGEFQPLGADFRRSVSVRVVAATNRALDKLMVAKEFRHDLFFRLQYFMIQVPPLRARGDDWRLLLEWSLFKLHQKYGVKKRFSPEALNLLSLYHWPGNIRELMSVTTMGYAHAPGDVIEARDFQEQIDLRGRNPGDFVEDVFQRIVLGYDDFWQVVHKRFMERDLNRGQVRSLMRKGLAETHGNYQELLNLFHMPQSQYQKFMDFLRHHDLKP
jgi:DNA-binding NtrC family response regulator